MQAIIRGQLDDSAALKQVVADTMAEAIEQAAHMWLKTLNSAGTIAFCGNGGSAADCQHLAGELVGRFRRERLAFAGIALTTDTSILTAIGNDFGFEHVYERQVEGLLKAGDLLLVISTSGNAENCLLAVRKAKEMGVATIAFTGASGGKLAGEVDLLLAVPNRETPRVQEAHITIGHILCDLVEAKLTE